MRFVLFILRDTALKPSPRPSSQQLQKARLKRGSYYPLVCVQQEGDHWCVELETPVGAIKRGYVYRSHAHILDRETGSPVLNHLDLKDDFLGVLCRYILDKRYVLEYGRGSLNLIYLVDFKQNGLGFRYLIEIPDNQPQLVGQWQAIIADDPTAYYPLPGQSKAWRLQENKLIQVGSLSVIDGSGYVNRGLFGIDQVASQKERRIAIGNVMAALEPQEHLEFIDCLKHHVRYQESHLYTFRTTILDLTDFRRCGLKETALQLFDLHP